MEVVRRREEREVTRSETNKRRIKGGKMHAYPHADRRKLNQAEVCLLEERKGERKSMQVFPWNNEENCRRNEGKMGIKTVREI